MLKPYTIKEVGKIINVPAGTIKQWEKDFSEFLMIPRSKGGARLFSKNDLNILLKIKQYRDQNIKIESIRNVLHKEDEPLEILETSLSVINDQISMPIQEEEPSFNAEVFFQAIEVYKQNVIDEVKEEIRNVVRKEIIEDVKKEISKGTLQTVKSIAHSIYQSTEKTKEEIHELSYKVEDNSNKTVEILSNHIQKSANETASELSSISTRVMETSKEISTLGENVSAISKDSYEEINTLSKRISKTSSEFAHYLNVTNNNIYSLNKELAKERENFKQEREHYQHEVIQREAAFQNMLTSFREAASAKEKKWWQIWS
ncbi:MAG: MerR family transcriptional regulator [Bacillota bacterium]|nr:MerR family transcriptional regulator [Bacillota bacterium]